MTTRRTFLATLPAIPHTWIGGEGPLQNPLPTMRAVLTRLGISNAPLDLHHNHFHVALIAPLVFAF